MKHFNARETYDNNPYIHKHVDLWVEDGEFSDFVQTTNTGTAGQVPIKQNDGTVKWEEGGSSSSGIVSTTYSELRELRDNGGLIPGQQYRITDYHCTTAQENTRAADHRFDIIVTADDESTLNENARAIQHEGGELTGLLVTNQSAGIEKSYIRDFSKDEKISDVSYYAWYNTDGEDYIYTNILDITEQLDASQLFIIQEGVAAPVSQLLPDIVMTADPITEDYFANSNLAAWELKYCLDNDVTRFYWAVVKTNAKLARHGDILPYIRSIEDDASEDYLYRLAWKRDIDILYSAVEEPAASDGLEDSPSSHFSGYTMDELGLIFEPASENEGFGVIYYMKDEFNNECPYDFKNIQFYRKYNSGTQTYSDIGTSLDGNAHYTFNGYLGENIDLSLNNSSIVQLNGEKVFGNSIKEYTELFYIFTQMGTKVSRLLKLNNICLIGDCHNNTFKKDCFNNTIEVGFSNIFGNECSNNTLCNANNNIFENSCCYNYLYRSYDNTFKSECGDSNNGTGVRLIGPINGYSKNNIFDPGIKYLTLNGADPSKYHVLSSAQHGGVETTTEFYQYDITNIEIHSINSDELVISFYDEIEGEQLNNVSFYYDEEDDAGMHWWADENWDYYVVTDSTSDINCNIGEYYDTDEHINELIINSSPHDTVITVARKTNGNIVQYCEADLIADQ